MCEEAQRPGKKPLRLFYITDILGTQAELYCARQDISAKSTAGCILHSKRKLSIYGTSAVSGIVI